MRKENKKKIVEQTTTGGAVIGAGGHVDLPLGLFDRPGPQNPTNFGDKAIVPSEMVANQLAVARPPVDDEDYTPSSKQELALAVSEISKTVPDSQIKSFYLRIKELAQESIDSENVEELDQKGEVEMQESLALQRTVNKFISQVDAHSLHELRIFSAKECVDIMESKKIVSVKKAQELRKKCSSLIEENLFKRFFIMSIVMPSAKENLAESRQESLAERALKKYGNMTVQKKKEIFEKVCR